MRLLGFLVSGLVISISLTSCGEDDPTTGTELIHAMYSAYEGKWYDKLSITEKVDYYHDGVIGHEETWNKFIQLPGKVRSNIGPVEFGNAEIFLNGSYYWFREGELIKREESTHVVLLLGFDVYQQPPESTLFQLGQARFDVGKMHSRELDGRPVYVVGAEEGDWESNQFWVDKKTLTMVRKITTSGVGNRIEVDLVDYERLGGGWIPTRLRFKTNGELTIEETYQEFKILDEIDPAVFDVDYFTTDF